MKILVDILEDRPLSCKLNDYIENIEERLSSSYQKTFVVVDDENKVSGTISYLDICMATSILGKPKPEIRVKEIMSANIFSIHVCEKEATAFSLMRNQHLKYLAAVDDENRFKGIVSFISLARRVISVKQEYKRMSLI